MVLARLLSGHELLQTAERAERVDNHLAHVAVTAQIELTLSDVARIVGNGVRDVSAGQRGHGDDGDGAAAGTLGELHGLLVDLRQVGIERAGHRVLRRNLVHTVAHDGERVGVGRHVGQQDEHRLVLLHGEVLGSRQRHVRDEESLHGRVLRRVDEGDDAVQGTGARKRVAEEIVVIVRHTHAAQDNLVALGTHGHERHHLVERLVGVGKEGNLLAGDERVVQVDARNARGDELAGLLAAHGVHGRAANLHLLALHLRPAVDGQAVGVEETSCQLVADLQGRTLAHEHDFCIGGDAASAFEDLQRHVVAHDFHHLRQLAVDGCQLIVAHALCLERASGLGYLTNLRIYFLKCCCHNT